MTSDKNARDDAKNLMRGPELETDPDIAFIARLAANDRLQLAQRAWMEAMEAEPFDVMRVVQATFDVAAAADRVEQANQAWEACLADLRRLSEGLS